jgi:Major intrinsic protein
MPTVTSGRGASSAHAGDSRTESKHMAKRCNRNRKGPGTESQADRRVHRDFLFGLHRRHGYGEDQSGRSVCPSRDRLDSDGDGVRRRLGIGWPLQPGGLDRGARPRRDQRLRVGRIRDHSADRRRLRRADCKRGRRPPACGRAAWNRTGPDRGVPVHVRAGVRGAQCGDHAKANEGNSFYGLAIGFTVLAGAFAVGGISGGAFNPAVALGQIVHGAVGVGHLWEYWLAQFVAGAAAGRAFLYIQGPETADAT